MKAENMKPKSSKDESTKNESNKDNNIIALTLLGVLAGLMGLAS